jgi:hypothetical protein
MPWFQAKDQAAYPKSSVFATSKREYFGHVILWTYEGVTSGDFVHKGFL